jgi:asparagine synthetase B (glutamine-hydrolysing)
MDDLLKYEEGQIALREAYRYPLRGAERVLATHKKQVMKYGEQVLRQLQRGDLTWQQLEAQDLAFMRQHS